MYVCQRREEFSHQRGESRHPTLEKHSVGLKDGETGLLGEKLAHSSDTVVGLLVNQQDQGCCWHILPSCRVAEAGMWLPHLISAQWETVITTNVVRIRRCTATLTVDPHACT